MRTLDTSSGAPSSTSGTFPGFGEGAPLDLSSAPGGALAGITERLRDGTFAAWSDTAAAVGYCARPVRLVGSATTIDKATGEIVSTFSSDQTPLGVLYRACGNRRAEVCPSCSRVYARDTFAMIRAGMLGGKTVPETVADNPLLFVTLTAPSFGHVHSARTRSGKPQRCRPRDSAQVCGHRRPIGCWHTHTDDDPAIGAPICGDCYDWHTAVVWQFHATELWRRTTIAMRRAVAAALGVPDSRLRDLASVQFAKVAEYQARGLVHFHALIRLDGPDGPGSPAPFGGDLLARLVEHATRSAELTARPVDAEDVPRVLAWGQQLDVRTVRDGHRTDDPDGPLSPEQVAGYLAKYATKDANSIRTPGSPRPHLLRLQATARELASRAAEHYGYALDARGKPVNPYLRLGKWAHMLGFRGHFSSKSRGYSLTLGRLRRARQRFQALTAEAQRTRQPLDTRDLDTLLLAENEETTLVVGSWAYHGTGWTSPGDEALALAAAARAREYDQWRANQRKTA